MARKKTPDEEETMEATEATETAVETTDKVKVKLKTRKEEENGNFKEVTPGEAAAPTPAPQKAAYNPPPMNGTGKKMEISEFKNKSMNELVEMALSLGVENPADLKKPALIFSILQKQSDNSGQVYAEGVLEVMPDGYGFLRSASYNYLAGPDDIYVSPAQIRMFALRKGDTVYGQIRMPRDNERFLRS